MHITGTITFQSQGIKIDDTKYNYDKFIYISKTDIWVYICKYRHYDKNSDILNTDIWVHM